MNNMEKEEKNLESKDLFNGISILISTAKNQVRSNLNYEMVILYWNIGKYIRTELYSKSENEYGKKVISNLSKQLTAEYGKGYSRSNLFNMIKLYDSFTDEKIIQTLSGLLSWSHFIEILKIDDSVKREFYISMSANERWSVRVLKNRINSMLYERTSLSKHPEKTILKDLKNLNENNEMSEDLFFRDPYVLDFLELQDTYSEKDLESAILAELESFMLELLLEIEIII